jgi:hypothetical protein
MLDGNSAIAAGSVDADALLLADEEPPAAALVVLDELEFLALLTHAVSASAAATVAVVRARTDRFLRTTV